MELTEPQRDALTELINIAFARAAASLSDLTGNRVELDVPELAVQPFVELSSALSQFLSGDVAIIHQVFSGPMDGDALLLMNHDGAVNLVRLLTDENAASSASSRLGTAGKEVLSEVGNILLNACLGVFGNLLHVRLSFTVPQLHVEALDEFFGSLAVGKAELQYGLIIGAGFEIRESHVDGHLVIVLGVTSLDQIVQEVENWAMRSATGSSDTENTL
jgi:chemotaxis protein CheC